MILELTHDRRITTGRYNWSIQRLNKSGSWQSFLFWPTLRQLYAGLKKHLQGKSTLRGMRACTPLHNRLEVVGGLCSAIDAIKADIDAIGRSLGRSDIHPAHYDPNPTLPQFTVVIDEVLAVTVDRYSWRIRQPGNVPGCYWPRLTFALTWLMEHRLRLSDKSIGAIRAEVNDVGQRILVAVNEDRCLSVNGLRDAA